MRHLSPCPIVSVLAHACRSARPASLRFVRKRENGIPAASPVFQRSLSLCRPKSRGKFAGAVITYPAGDLCHSHLRLLLEQKRGIESLYGEARNAAAPVRFSISCQRYPFAVDAFLRLLRIAGENRFRFGLRETGMDGVIDDVYDHRADVGVICLTDLTEKIICRLLDARELEFHELAAVCPCIYVRGGHPLAGRSSVTEEELDGYPYVAFEHDQGVASDFFEEYPMVSLKKPAKCISVNNRATAMYVLASIPMDFVRNLLRIEAA